MLAARAPASYPIAVSVPLARAVPPVVALGGFLKATACVTSGRFAHLGPLVGDLETPDALDRLAETVDDLIAHLGIGPEAVIVDRHPDLPSERLADAMGLPVITCQHHHAHIASVAAEHRHDGPVLGLACDGFGLGDDGKAWGGELLWVDGAAVERMGHLAPLMMPGGDKAAKEPWRMAAAALHAIGRGAEIAARFPDEPLAAGVARLLSTGSHCPTSTSLGRLFDAAAGLLGLSRRMAFEAEAAIKLEAYATAYGMSKIAKVDVQGLWRMSKGSIDLSNLLDRLAGETDQGRGAAIFHAAVAAALADAVLSAGRETGLRTVALSGGCFMNKLLSAALTATLEASDFTVLTQRAVLPTDAGLSLGQAWIAAHHPT